MSGKSFLASQFPNPVIFNTDGNAEANTVPSVQLRNIKASNGKIKRSVIDQLDKLITALQTEKHTYETVVLDVIDDIVVMIEQYICDKEDVETLGDIPYGKGYAAFTMNVIYISRNATKLEGTTEIEIPSLKEKHQNIVNGNCDLSIQCKKVGKNYIRVAKARRKDYMRDQVDDETILGILDTITGVFGRTAKTTKKKQDEIVKQLEQNEDILKSAEDTPSEKATDEVSETKPTKQKAKATAPVNQAASKVEPAKTARVQRRIKPKI